MKTKKSKGLLISAIIVGILTILGVVGVAGSLFIALNGYGIKIEDSVYFKQSDLIVNYSQTNPEQIESYTVKIVNTTNKEFIARIACIIELWQSCKEADYERVE